MPIEELERITEEYRDTLKLLDQRIDTFTKYVKLAWWIFGIVVAGALWFARIEWRVGTLETRIIEMSADSDAADKETLKWRSEVLERLARIETNQENMADKIKEKP